MVKKVFYLIVAGQYDREPIRFEEEPTEQQIADAIIEKRGKTARVEQRYELVNN
ncbi:hypothetical protein [Priestia aryabhattai]